MQTHSRPDTRFISRRRPKPLRIASCALYHDESLWDPIFAAGLCVLSTRKFSLQSLQSQIRKDSGPRRRNAAPNSFDPAHTWSYPRRGKNRILKFLAISARRLPRTPPLARLLAGGGRGCLNQNQPAEALAPIPAHIHACSAGRLVGHPHLLATPSGYGPLCIANCKIPRALPFCERGTRSTSYPIPRSLCLPRQQLETQFKRRPDGDDFETPPSSIPTYNRYRQAPPCCLAALGFSDPPRFSLGSHLRGRRWLHRRHRILLPQPPCFPYPNLR